MEYNSLWWAVAGIQGRPCGVAVVDARNSDAFRAVFCAESRTDAVRSAALFASQLAQTTEKTVVELTVGRFEPCPIAPDGMYQNPCFPPCFEWKASPEEPLDKAIDGWMAAVVEA